MKANHFYLFCLAAACAGETETASSSKPTESTADWSDPGQDTGEPEDTSSDPDLPPAPSLDFWTSGPGLPECTSQSAAGTRVALSGVLLLPEGPQAGSLVYDSSTGLIECAGDCDTADATVVCTQGVVSPGLIDAHNHMQYNALPPWQHAELYTSRYQWQSDGDYYDYREAYDGISNSYKCEIGKWAELRTLAGGGTSVVGSSGGACIAGLVRNLDEDEVAHGLDGYDLKYSSSNVTGMDGDDGDYFRGKLESGDYGAVLNHVAEGVQGSVSVEIDHMFDIGMAGGGMAFVHSTDATVSQLARMRAEGTTIIWSPRSNLDLYWATTPADIAMRMGIPVALGPDWTWSGSSNPSRELRCAQEYLFSRQTSISDKDLWTMATADAARSVGLDGVMGTLYEGMVADISVFSYSEEPYRPLIEADPRDVLLVLVNGQPLYGTGDLVDSLPLDTGLCEEVSACGESRSFCVRQSSGEDGHADLEASLSAALGEESIGEGLEYAKELFGLWICEDQRESCDISAAADGDVDGDGSPDASDLCPYAYDPLQGDHDSDGAGDACDPCPLVPDETECEHDPADIDDDGTPNEEDSCPWIHNPGQEDSDGDGEGDICDICPETSNADGAGCPFSIGALRDPDHPDHPPEGTVVRIDAAVVTGGEQGYGYYVQDPEAAEYGGIFVYEPDGSLPALGTVVNVQGEYIEYYGLSELKDCQVETLSEGPPLEPIVVADPCSLATEGSLAEPYEGMLVQLQNVSVSNENPDAPDEYREFEVGGCLRVDDRLCEDCWDTPPAEGSVYSALTGIQTYSYSNHKLLPRLAGDLELE
jgi:hypothetical protein